MNITDICIKKPLFAWMIMAATILFGVVALTRIGISQFPDVDFPTITVNITWDGAKPEQVEHDVIERVEEALTQVEGVSSISSVARQSSGTVTVELELSRNVDLAMQDVQARIAQIKNLPRDMELPTVSKTNPEDQPIMWVGLSGPFSPQLLSDTARYVVKERLQRIQGVGEVSMGGTVERNVRVWVDATRLDERNLVVTDVIAALQREHVELPAGRLDSPGREIGVRVLGEAIDLERFRSIVVREVDGVPVRLQDIALIEDGFEDLRRISRFNGEPAQGLGIRKQRGANAVAVARAVREALREIQTTLPDGMNIGINFDSTQFIEDSVHEIQWELVLAVALTALVCWLFLGSLSSTLNVVLAIPMSLLGTVAVISFLGFTLNTFTLLALGLSVGIVVDDAIMVLENIFRHAEMGKPRIRAAREGTREIAFAAMAATLAIVAIFLPVVFMQGVVGKFFLQFGITLSIAVMFSYLEAVTLAPARCSQMLDVSREKRNPIGRVADRAFASLARLYARVLAFTLRSPVTVLILATAILGASVFVFMSLKSEFVPSQDQSRLMVRIQTAVGSDLAETDQVFRRAEEFVRAQPETERVFSVVGGFGGQGSNGGVMFVTMKDPQHRTLSQQAFSAVLRKELNGYPGVRAVVQDLSQQGFTAKRGFPIEFSVQGPDWDTLVKLSATMMEELKASGQVIDLDSNYEAGAYEVTVSRDTARCADLGVSSLDVSTTINSLIGGIHVGKFSTGGRRLDIRLRLMAPQRSRPEDIGRLRVRAQSGELVPLTALTATEEHAVLQAVTRSDRQRAISIYANVAPGFSQQDVLQHINTMGQEMPPGYRIMLGGSSQAFQDSMGSLTFALILGIAVAYMILVSQFNSLMHPLTVLTILPLSVAGAAFALMAAGYTLNIFSMIGLLLLMGIVKKNSIILVDYANSLRQPHDADDAPQIVLDARAAMQAAGPVRLRPILMTSIATIMAAIPAALALGPGGELRAPMAWSILGGIAVSTLLSLVVVPAFYVVADRFRRGAAIQQSKPGTTEH